MAKMFTPSLTNREHRSVGSLIDIKTVCSGNRHSYLIFVTSYVNVIFIFFKSIIVIIFLLLSNIFFFICITVFNSFFFPHQIFLVCQFLFLSCFSWKDPNNDFKKTLKLIGVPTLLKYGTVRIPS